MATRMDRFGLCTAKRWAIDHVCMIVDRKITVIARTIRDVAGYRTRHIGLGHGSEMIGFMNGRIVRWEGWNHAAAPEPELLHPHVIDVVFHMKPIEYLLKIRHIHWESLGRADNISVWCRLVNRNIVYHFVADRRLSRSIFISAKCTTFLQHKLYIFIKCIDSLFHFAQRDRMKLIKVGIERYI